ncbi:MAG: 30S ribosomal protein S6 [Nitrospirae bacterium]|nr:30S ribosomal protein S6 [Nitrospirota bacterium]
MNYYENFVLIEPSLPDEEIDQVSNKIQEQIKKEGGEIIREDRWGRRKLAYELNKRTQGYYILYTFKAPPEIVKKMETFYKVFDPVFKFMIIKLRKKEIEALQEQLKGTTTEKEA